jgi:hypothetical protein
MLAVVGGVIAALLSIPSADAVQGGDDSTDNPAARVVQPQQVFQLISTDPSDEGGGPLVAFGPIHANGHDTVLDARRDRFVFPDGNLIIRHRPLGTPVQRFDPVTCSSKFVEVGHWRVTRGTRDYADAAGQGTYRVVGEGIGRKDAQGQCTDSQPPLVFYVKIRAVGSLSF